MGRILLKSNTNKGTNNIVYVFNRKKINDTQAKQKMQNVFQGAKADDIFDIFWNKAAFKSTFFPTRPNTPQGKIDARDDFNTLVNNLDNKIFGFVITN